MKRTFVLLALLALGAVAPAAAQRREIRGTVTGAQGQPLPAASVVVAGTRTGTTTDQRGAFVLNVPAGNVQLQVSALGYRTASASVAASQSTVSVALQQDVLNLEGVVVTGQATTVKRQNLANAVAVVSSQELQRAPAQTVEKALQGKIAGATIQTNSGAPGGGAQIRIRGISSLIGNSEPLYVVDGVVVSNKSIPGGQNAVSGAGTRSALSSVQDNVVNRIADINPEDIESIEVLKGASASAIYGAQASNGVILVRTKSGRAGRPRYTFQQRLGYSELAKTLGSRDFTRAEAVPVFCGANPSASCLATKINPFFNGETPIATYDNERAVFGRRAPGRETSASVSGGSEATRYYASGTLLDEKGIAANTGYKKESAKLSVDHDLGSRGKISLSTNVLHSVAARGLTGNDNNGVSYYAAISGTPNFFNLAGRKEDGTYVANPFYASNPVQTAALSQNDEDTWRTITAANLSYGILSSDVQSLRLVGVGGVDFFRQRNQLYYPPELQFEPNDQIPGTAVTGDANDTNLNGNLNLVHQLTPGGGAFTATTSAGIQYQDEDLQYDAIWGQNLTGAIRLPEKAAKVTLDGYRNRVRNLGFYGQEQLVLFDERLNLTASLRADRSSTNADPGKYYYYPKAAGSFRFGQLASFVNDVKVRAAYGSSGNLPLYNFKYTPLQGGKNIEGKPALAVFGDVGASDLRPERATEFEGGVDLTLFNGAARVELTGYNKTVSDFLLSRGLAPSMGFTTLYFNGGKLKAHGYEAMVEATPVRTTALDWITRVTYFQNRQKMTELPVPAFRPSNSSFGYVYGGYRIENNVSPTAMFGYRGRNPDGTRTEVVFGDADPRFQMGFTNDLTFGAFSVSSLLDWQNGGKVANLTRSYYDDAQNSVDWHMPAGVSATRPMDQCDYRCLSGEEREDLIGKSYSVYLEDADFLKLREVSLSYSLPGAVLSRVGGFSSARFTVAARNLYTWQKYTGLDPEVSNFGNRAVGRNIDVTPFPPSRSFWFSVNFGF